MHQLFRKREREREREQQGDEHPVKSISCSLLYSVTGSQFILSERTKLTRLLFILLFFTASIQCLMFISSCECVCVREREREREKHEEKKHKSELHHKTSKPQKFNCSTLASHVHALCCLSQFKVDSDVFYFYFFHFILHLLSKRWICSCNPCFFLTFSIHQLF